MSIEHQLQILRRITWHIRNSILCQVLVAALFVLTSCAIGLHDMTAIPFAEKAAIALFISGLLLLLVRVLCFGIDIFKSYRLIGLELDAVSTLSK